jgi:hypothetical protein
MKRYRLWVLLKLLL